VAVAVGLEGDPVARPGRVHVCRIRELGDVDAGSTVRAHAIDFPIAVAHRGEGDARPVKAPGGLHVLARLVGQAANIRAVEPHLVNLGVHRVFVGTVALEHHPFRAERAFARHAAGADDAKVQALEPRLGRAEQVVAAIGVQMDLERPVKVGRIDLRPAFLRLFDHIVVAFG